MPARLFLSSCFLFISVAMAQDSLLTHETDLQNAPRMFIDCGSCDMNYIRSEMNFVNYVIDRNDADIFVMVTRQSTGSNGHEYTLTLEGRKTFHGMTDTLIYITEQELSQDEVREKTLKYMKIGMVRYLGRTPLAEDVSVNFNQEVVVEQPEDRWDYWVFRSSLDGWFDGQSSYSSSNMHGRLSARRVTEAWKLDFTLRLNYNEDSYVIDDQKYISINRNPSLGSEIVKSLTAHLSTGLRAGGAFFHIQ